MAIRTSSTNADIFKDDVTCEMNSYGLIEQLFAIRNIKGALSNNAFSRDNDSAHNNKSQALNLGPTSKTLKVLEAFTLDYKVKWPLTLIISRKTVTKY